jgi:hypothetical protein
VSFGLYSLSAKANTTYIANIISTNILKAKPFPVIKGKNIDDGTINGIKSIRKRPPKIE